MPSFRKHSGVWKEIESRHRNDGGVWKDVETKFRRHNGLWKPCYNRLVTQINPIEFVLEKDNDGNGSPIVITLPSSINDADTLIIVYQTEWSGITTQSVGSAKLDYETCVKDLHVKQSAESELVIYRRSAVNVSRSTSVDFDVSFPSGYDANDMARAVIAVYRIPGGVVDGLIASNTEWSQNGGQHSLDVDFRVGAMVVGHYSGQDVGNITYSGVDSYRNLEIVDTGFASASVGHSNSYGDEFHTVSFSHNNQTNDQGTCSAVAVYN